MSNKSGRLNGDNKRTEYERRDPHLTRNKFNFFAKCSVAGNSAVPIAVNQTVFFPNQRRGIVEISEQRIFGYKQVHILKVEGKRLKKRTREIKRESQNFRLGKGYVRMACHCGTNLKPVVW